MDKEKDPLLKDGILVLGFVPSLIILRQILFLDCLVWSLFYLQKCVCNGDTQDGTWIAVQAQVILRLFINVYIPTNIFECKFRYIFVADISVPTSTFYPYSNTT